MDAAYVQGLHAALEQSIAPDTAVIKAATVQLNTVFYTSAQCVPALFEIGSTSPNAGIRQLALVELRKRVSAKKSKQWLAQVPATRGAIKGRLLEIIVSETSSQTRTAATRFASSLASIELPEGQWPELLPWLLALSADAVAAKREVALQTMYMLLDTLVLTPTKPGGGIEHHISEFLVLFGKTLQDPESLSVRVWTVRALGKLSEFIEPDEATEIAGFQALVPGIVSVIQHSLEASDEASAKSGLEVIEGLTLAEAPLFGPHLVNLVQFLMNAAANRAFENDLRIMVLNCLLFTVKMKKAVIQKLNLAGAIITALLPIGAEPEPADAEEDVPARTAFRVIDTLATSLPPAQVFPPLFAQVQALAASPDPAMRKSAITAFGVVVEGCSLFIQPHLETLWPLIQGGLSDPEVMVRKAACSALGCLCEMLDEDCAKQHAMLLPLVFKLIGDPETQRSACVALDCLLEVLGDDIEPYIPSLMESLLQLLASAPLNLKGTVVGAIGSAAHASKAKFAPYFQASMDHIVPFLLLTEEGDELDLRGVAQDTVGTLAEAVGKEAFRPYFAPLMTAALEATAIPNAPQLKECSYIFFAVISRVYAEEFQAYLPTVMPLLLAALGQSEIDESLFPSGNDGDYGTGVDDDDEDGEFEDIDEDLDEDSDEMFNASTAIAIEKECAADAISEIFAHTKTPFLPYIEPVVRALLPGLKHPWHDGIRKSAVAALLGFISTFHEMSDAGKWTKGSSGVSDLEKSRNWTRVLTWKGDNKQSSLQANVKQLAGAILPDVIELWSDEEERDVVNELCNSFSAALMIVGPALIVPEYVEPICTHLQEILQRKAACQIDGVEDDANIAAGEQSEYDAALISAAMDLVGTLASVLGADFAQLMPMFQNEMTQYYDLERSAGDRSTAIGSLAEIVNGLESAVTPFTDALFPLFLRSLADPEAEVQSNGAFAMGSLIFHSQTDLSSQYMNILGVLHPLFAPNDDRKAENAQDNACGCVSRMILKNISAVPLDQVLPVLIQALPLKRDFAESEKTFAAIFELFRAENPIILANLDHLLNVFAHALASLSEGFYPGTDGAQITEATKNEVVELLKAINAQQPAKIAAAGLTPYLA
ncbi:importin-4, partial [Phenoliferia sp. Uapishka_3]